MHYTIDGMNTRL